ncbi:MAG: mannose-1-phosphate guanylyltransferase [Lentisphaeria bacterium]|nr:mannose-1-phosphate guanylyltransferase [Lentisphaeria bacterium]
MSEIFCVIMAGGRGERLWPRSRKNSPKQMLNLLGDGALLEQTLLRLQGFAAPENILIITGCEYVDRIRSLCSQLPTENIIGEPERRNTAPCVALAAGIVRRTARTGDPVLVVRPADHAIVGRNAMISDFEECCECAVKTDSLATIGIMPDAPSPEYGYIECGDAIAGWDKISQVRRFVEKPPVEKARKLLEAGNCRWNSGMFAFPLRTLLAEMKKQTPELLTFVDRVAAVRSKDEFAEVLASEYGKLPKTSIDYAIMEHAEKVIVRDASFGWDDIGSWTALRKILPRDENGNVRSGETFLLDSRNCIVFSDGDASLVSGIDLEDMIIVRTADAVLVCPVRSSGRIRELMAGISREKRLEKFL